MRVPPRYNLGAQYISALYDSWAWTYDLGFRWRRYNAPKFLAAQFPETFNMLKPQLKVLDVGVGTGLMAARFKQANPSCHVTGIDLSQKMLDRAARKGVVDSSVRIDFQKAGIPFEDKSFDVVVSSGVFELLSWPQSVIAEMGRVLKDSGGFSITSYSDSPFRYDGCNYHDEVY